MFGTPGSLTATAGGPRPGRGRGGLRRLAAPRYSVAFFLLTAVGALAVAEAGAAATWAMAVPFGLFLLNLLAALLTHPRFRLDLPLLLFHLALLALVLLFVLGRLTYMDGIVPVTRGAMFDGALVQVEHGPLHPGIPAQLRFRNDGFVDSFPPNGNEFRTDNRVRWWAVDGQAQAAEIGDDRPLVIAGYRIYATRRGFAPYFLWEEPSGRAEYASLQLGSVGPDGRFAGASWRLSGGAEMWVGLHHVVRPPARGSHRIDLGARDVTTPVVVRVGEQRHELLPGQSMALAGGRLTYVRLDAWLGYRIVYDMTTPWMIGCVLLGVVSLIWFYVKRVFAASEAEVRE